MCVSTRSPHRRKSAFQPGTLADRTVPGYDKACPTNNNTLCKRRRYKWPAQVRAVGLLCLRDISADAHAAIPYLICVADLLEFILGIRGFVHILAKSGVYNIVNKERNKQPQSVQRNGRSFVPSRSVAGLLVQSPCAKVLVACKYLQNHS